MSTLALGLIIAAAVVVVLAVLGFLIVPAVVQRILNRALLRPPYTVRKETRRQHAVLFVADLHADPLLWKRDLLYRRRYGHIDLPRLVEGNVGLQVFGAPTKVPLGINPESNVANRDLITLLSICQAWPAHTWRSLLQRALYLAEKLERYCARSTGQLVQIRTAVDLEDLLQRRRADPRLVGALLSLEGVHALEGELSNLDLLYEAGYRIIGLSHLFDNEAAGSSYGRQNSGLTGFGRELVQSVQEHHMLLDLAHAASAAIDDTLALTRAPLLVSHTGLRGTCDNSRNLSDDHARAIAATGGVIGVALFGPALAKPSVEEAARTIRYGADLVGAQHLALGSDFDGAVICAVDCTGLPLLTEALTKQRFDAEEIAQIMGGNALRLLHQVLPS